MPVKTESSRGRQEPLMTLSPLAPPFFSCSSYVKLIARDAMLGYAKASLTDFDFSLFYQILCDWESSPTLTQCFAKWQKFNLNVSLTENSLHILSFNVRGLDLRIHEVILLSSSFNLDILILQEIGRFDLPYCRQAFYNYKLFYQKGENSNGGVMILVKNDIKSYEIYVSTPNVCAVEINMEEEKLRLLGLYASDSRSWKWDDISPLITDKCVIYGDFNTDIKADGTKAEALLEWADAHLLAPFLPDSPTSLRSDRTIDFAFSNYFTPDIHTYKGNTTSDHKPILSIVPTKHKENALGRNIHWKVFTLFTEYVYSYWEDRWNLLFLDGVYNDYISFLSLLISRCTITFPLKKYRIAIPGELRSFLSYTRAMSFKQLRSHDENLKHEVSKLKKVAKAQIKHYISSKLNLNLAGIYSSSPLSVAFWSRTKKFFKPSSTSLHGFILPNGSTIKDAQSMATEAVNYYENFFRKHENIIRPHPYTDAPFPLWENFNEEIPQVGIEEVIDIVINRSSKKSCDAHGLCNFMFRFLPLPYWSLLTKIFNLSLSKAIMPTAWKDVRMLLLAKKDSICWPSATRPISLLDIFLKINEKVFLTRFQDILTKRGLLPDTQSGFRQKFRLQTRVLLFLEQTLSLMANSSPVATVFVDFKTAFDQLWFEGCIGKLRRLGIPNSFLKWIETWLSNRRAFVEVKGIKSRWFQIFRGGPQGSVLTPTIFITYHSDMTSFLNSASSFMFADDLAAVVGGRIGDKYSQQCLDLECRLKSFTDALEFYATLSVQPINYEKTECLWSARAIGNPKFEIVIGENKVKWTKEFKYLGYWITPKIGWNNMISKSMLKIRQRIARVNSFTLFGTTSIRLRKTLFLSYVLPLFTNLFILYPLFTQKQRDDLSHFYYTSLKRIMHCNQWGDSFFAYIFDEISLDDRCFRYWNRYIESLANTIDGELLFEQANLNEFRSLWLQSQYPIKGLHKSKRFVEYTSVFEKCMQWCVSNASRSSVIDYDILEIQTLEGFPETF